MTRTIRVLGIAALALALSAVAGSGAAGAKIKKKKVHGQVTIIHEHAPGSVDRFFGAVSSPNPRCNRAATINLGFRPAFEGGGSSSFPRTTVASTQSDGAGNWEILYEVQPNGISPFSSYSASTPKRTLKTKKRGLLLVCKIAQSETLTLASGGP